MTTPSEKTHIILYWRHKPTPRLQYILQFLFNELMGLTFETTSNRDEFLHSLSHKISYGTWFSDDIPYLDDANLLSENFLRPDKPDFSGEADLPILYPSARQDALLPFDLFSASFWLLSRYEEYLPYQQDKHNRFPATESLLFRYGLLKIPVVNLWAKAFQTRITAFYPQLQTETGSYTYIPTLDIDHAWAYLHKPWWRQGLGMARALLSGNFANLRERGAVLCGKKRDPFDTFEHIHHIHQDFEPPHFFYLVGKYGEHDKNTPISNKHFKRLIQHNNTSGETGIHPSYASGDHPSRLAWEKKSLENVIRQPITKSRQHFLRLKLPDTYLALEKADIAEDFTMGFADQPGFRAGTCSPFRFYNLTEERTTELTVIPLTVMDGTLKDYLGLTTDEALEVIMNLCETTRRYQGVFVTLWHNETLCEQQRWVGWSALYQKVVAQCSASSTGRSTRKEPSESQNI